MKEKKLETHSGDVLLTEAYAWDYDAKITAIAREVPYPNVVVSNFAIAHRHSDDKSFKEHFEQTEKKYWKEDHQPKEPTYRFFQSARDCHGKKSGGIWSGENIRRNSEILRAGFEELGFSVRIERLFTHSACFIFCAEIILCIIVM